MPGIVLTNMTTEFTKKANLAAKIVCENSDSYAKALLATVDKQRVTFGCCRHALLVNNTV